MTNKFFNCNLSALLFLLCALSQVITDNLMAAYFASIAALFAHYLHQVFCANQELYDYLKQHFN